MSTPHPSHLPGRLVVAAAALMFALPSLYPNHLWPLPTFFEEWLAAIFALLTVGLVAAANAGRPVRIPAVVAPIGMFVAVLLVQLAIGKYAYAQQIQWGVAFVLLAAVVAWAGAQARQLVGLEKLVTILAVATAVSAVANSVCLIAQVYGIPDWLAGNVLIYQPTTRPYGNLGQSNLFVDYAALGLVSLIYLFVSRPIRSVTIVITSLPLLVSVSLAGSRAALLFMFTIAAVALVMRRRSESEALKRAVRGVIALTLGLIAVDIAMRVTGLHIGQGLLGRFGEMFAEGHRASDGVGMRLQIWRIALDVFLDHPILGAGFGSFGYEYVARAPEFAASGGFGHAAHAHNLVLQLLADTGILGAACGLFALGAWLVRACKAPPSTERWWAVSIVSVVLVHSLVEYPIWYANFLVIVAFAIGAVETREWSASRPRVVLAACTTLVLCGGWFLAGLHRDFDDLRRWLVRGDRVELERLGGQARLNEIVAGLRARMLRPQTERELAMRFGMSEADIDEKLAINGRLLHFAPGAPILGRQILILSLAGRSAEANVWLERKLWVFPDAMPSFRQTVRAFARERPAQFAALANEIDQRLQAARSAALGASSR